MIGVQRAVGEAAEHTGHRPTHDGHARAAADEHDLAEAFDLGSAVAQRAQHRIAQAGQEIAGGGLELGGGDVRGEFLALPDDGERRRIVVAQGAAAALGGGAQHLAKGVRALAGEIAGPLHAIVRHRGDDVVEVLAAQAVVTGRGAHLDDAIEDLDQGDIEGAAAKVEHQERRLFVQGVDAIGQGGGRGLVDQPLDLEARQFASQARRLALAIVEIGWHGDDRAIDGLAQPGLGVGLEAAQHQGRKLLGRVGARAQMGLAMRAHVTFERGHGLLRVGRLALARRHADQKAPLEDVF